MWWRFAPRELHAHPQAVTKDEASALGEQAFERPLQSRSFWFLFASYFLQSYLGYIFVFWFYLYLVQVRHFEVLKAASFTALPWVATIFAIPLGGVLSDAAVARWGATWGRRSVPLIALSSAAIFLVLGARTQNAMMAVGALTACTVLVLSTEGAFWATVTQLAGARSGVAGGVMNFGGNLGGIVSPVLTPWLAERIGWEAALTLTAGLAVAAGLLWLRVRAGDEAGGGTGTSQ
jgi:ACS family glucarate transporter-like MFS transporter